MPTACWRFCMRRTRLERLYAVKSKPRLTLRYWSSSSTLSGSSLIHPSRLDEGDQRAGDFREGQHEIHAARLDRGVRHAEELGRALVLGEHGAAHLLDRLYPHGAVAPRAAQDQRDRALLERARDRLEQQV